MFMESGVAAACEVNTPEGSKHPQLLSMKYLLGDMCTLAAAAVNMYTLTAAALKILPSRHVRPRAYLEHSVEVAHLCQLLIRGLCVLPQHPEHLINQLGLNVWMVHQIVHGPTYEAGCGVMACSSTSTQGSTPCERTLAACEHTLAETCRQLLLHA